MDIRVDIVHSMDIDFCIQLLLVCIGNDNQHHLHLQHSQDNNHKRYQYSDQHKLGRQQYYQGSSNILDLVGIRHQGNNRAIQVRHNSTQYQNMDNPLDNWYDKDTL